MAKKEMSRKAADSKQTVKGKALPEKKASPTKAATKPKAGAAGSVRKAAPAKPPQKSGAKVAVKAHTPPSAKPAPAKTAKSPQKITPKAAPKTPTVKSAAPKAAADSKAASKPVKTVPAKASAPKKATVPAKALAPKPVAKPPITAKKPAAAMPKQTEAAKKSASAQRSLTALKSAAQSLAARKQAPKTQAPATNAKKPVQPANVQALAGFQPSGLFNGIRVAEEAKPFPVKNPYSLEELEKLRQSLVEERMRLLNQIASLSGVTMESMSSAKEGSGYSLHIAEHATDLQTAEANLGVRSIEEERLEQVEQALERIQTNLNHYGLCMACGNKIGIQRLIAQPHALLCLPCRSRYETLKARRGY
jgi:DnaK suppressor protein